MDQRTRNAFRRPIEILFSAALVLIVLTACGGDGDDDSATEEVETVQSDEPTTATGTAESDGAAAASPTNVAIAVPDGTTVEAAVGGSPTPAIIVAAPSIDAPSEGATPAGLSGDATPAVAAPEVPVTGDGTGGAPREAAGEEPAGDAAVVDSCTATSYPPYTGDSPVQANTVEVNFRAGPGTDCDALGDPLAAGTVVEVLSDPVTREGEADLAWVAVSIDGTEGWLATDFLEPAE